MVVAPVGPDRVSVSSTSGVKLFVSVEVTSLSLVSVFLSRTTNGLSVECMGTISYLNQKYIIYIQLDYRQFRFGESLRSYLV